jgi:CBS domain containing-hemolysin-like protein
MFRRRPPSPDDKRAHIERQASERTGDDQERLILSALDDLRDTTVREVMTPRVDVVGLPIPVRAPDVAKAVRESGHSVFPVYDEDLDRLVGVLYVNDLLRAGWELDARNGDENGGRAKPTPLEISRRLRQPYMVPESLLVMGVLADMRRDHRSFAVVVDEYGGMAGVLTVKDLLSALVGDLRDEFDHGKEPDIIRVDRTRWLVDGSASVDDVREQLGLDVPEGEYVTLGGFLFDAFGHIPEEGERLNHDGWELRVAEMDRRRVAKVVLQAIDEDTVAAGGSLPADGL